MQQPRISSMANYKVKEEEDAGSTTTDEDCSMRHKRKQGEEKEEGASADNKPAAVSPMPRVKVEVELKEDDNTRAQVLMELLSIWLLLSRRGRRHRALRPLRSRERRRR